MGIIESIREYIKEKKPEAVETIVTKATRDPLTGLAAKINELVNQQQDIMELRQALKLEARDVQHRLDLARKQFTDLQKEIRRTTGGQLISPESIGTGERFGKV